MSLPSVVILGASSFIGSCLHVALSQGGVSVLGASRQECDLLDAASTAAYIEGVPSGSHIVFCAVLNRDRCQEPTSFVANVKMVENLIDATRGRAFRSVVYLSAADVYGIVPALPITETTPVEPSGHYARAKLEGERLLQAAFTHCPVAIFRLPGVYGAGDGGRSTLGRFVRMCARGDAVCLTGRGQALRDYVDVRDVVRVVRACLEQPRADVFNVASGRSLPLKEIVERIRSALGSRSVVTLSDEPSGGAANLVFNPAKLQGAFPGPFIRLEDGIEQYCRLSAA